MNNYKKGIRITLFFALFISPVLSFAQFEKRIIKTDSSIIKELRYQHGTEFMEYVFRRSVIKYKWVDKNGSTITTGNHDTIGNLIGVWLEYDASGKLVKIEDFEKRAWAVMDKQKFPYKNFLDRVKKNADRIIIKTYGKDFFKKNVRWNFNTSVVYFEDGTGLNWTQSFEKAPTNFLVRYDIKLDSEIFPDMIEIRLDSSGCSLVNNISCNEQKGFEKLNAKKAITLTSSKAYKEAEKNGFIAAVTKVNFALVWECLNNVNSKYNGRFLYYVYTSERSNKDSASAPAEFAYNIYVLNPWNGRFIEEKKFFSTKATLQPYTPHLINEFLNDIKAAQ